MQALWNLDKTSLKEWANFVKQNEDKELPKRRRHRNVRRKDIDLSKGEIWRVLIGCQVTTQQRSGPGSAAHTFMQSKSPTLSLTECRKSRSVSQLVQAECRGAGLRRGTIIGENLSRIFDYLESGGWKQLQEQLDTLVSNTSLAKERKVVEYILESKKFPGLGQKQARNFIQWLGLSRYEIPLDSRVMKKMKEMGATFVPRSSSLIDETVYVFVQDVLQKIAQSLEIYPCELDACIFASFDEDSDDDVDQY
ncbi:hypothetical protein SAMN05192549_10757 [Duganella sacchari]|uniref:Uncharacterized protein n=1 Tax=Duganella sacchari TaxID=551987 RepID=A0A1M7QHU6_9BURK|nr:hypothetical protein [Duganella sacchari]SHN30319.1 hypothetical protein SAMN05192549_10757 [Duganella sacchari]